MITPVKTANNLNKSFKANLILGMCALLVCFSTGVVATNVVFGKMIVSDKSQDSVLSAAIQAQITLNKQNLYYPASVGRFYKKSGYKLRWVAPDTVKMYASEAMLVLDCVTQYGLSPSDYHPQELLYEKLNTLTQHFDKTSIIEKARFDIILTDAVIALINNLHYGKLNPDYFAEKIDTTSANSCSAEVVLATAMQEKNFAGTILNVQPKSQEYADMQYHLHLLTGLYAGDCYEIPDSDIRKISVNMERLRWINSDDKTYIHINIPSYTLKFHQPDTTYPFKVVVGKPENPTPTLQSAVSYFTTAPEWRVPHKIFVRELLPRMIKDINYLENNHYTIYDNKGNYIAPNASGIARVRQNPSGYSVTQSSGCDNSLGMIVFRFPNIYDIYLHDTPEQQLFAKQERAFSHGCIRVQHAENFAELLLKNDGSTEKITDLRRTFFKHQTKNFSLKKAIPIKITYLTCEVKEGVLIDYKDIYNLDRGLESALYNIDVPLVVK